VERTVISVKNLIKIWRYFQLNSHFAFVSVFYTGALSRGNRRNVHKEVT